MIDRRDNSGNIILLLNNYTIKLFIIELVDYISRDGPDMPYM